MNQIYEEMKEAVLEGEEEQAARLARQVLDENLPLKEVMDEGFLAGIQEAGRLYAEGSYYLPDLICAADAMKAALETLGDEIRKPTSQVKSRGKILLTTVQGDVHDIGKVIVGSMLTAAGYTVIDLGVDVPNEEVVRRVAEEKPDFLGLSALLTTTMAEQGHIIRLLKEQGMRDQIRVMIGGAPVTHEYGQRIGADGYSDDAVAAVALAGSFTG